MHRMIHSDALEDGAERVNGTLDLTQSAGCAVSYRACGACGVLWPATGKDVATLEKGSEAAGLRKAFDGVAF